MKIKNTVLAFASLAAFTLTACNEDDLGKSIFADDLMQVNQGQNEFDLWLRKNYVDAYNINLQYRYIDNESDRYYNVIPADFDKSKALAILVKHLWLDAYTEVMDSAFLKQYSPRIIQLTGSYKYQQNTSGESGGVVMGTAEGGIKVMLYGVNRLDIDNPYINVVNPYSTDKWSEEKFDMNHWFFHTMHHEFCHILTQKKEYTTEFRTISASDYHASDWVNVADQDAATEGFVTGYGSGEYNEDFAEIYATYVTMTADAWQMIIDQAGDKGAPILEKKLGMVRDYFKNSWNLDIDKMREVVLRRSYEALTLDLRTLK